MFIKIYFNNNPLFLCDNQHDSAIIPYLNHADSLFINEFSVSAIDSMLYKMQQPNVHAGIFLHHSVAALKKAFFERITLIQAAGGVTINGDGELLLIFRRGKWDLPKGKLEEGEKAAEAAVREVQEETGLTEVILNAFLLTTYHTYYERKKLILKENHWYRMQVDGSPILTPQEEEDITQTKWIKPADLPEIIANTFPSTEDVLKAFEQFTPSVPAKS